MLFDYEVLKLIWWALVGILLVGFAIMGGQDMGICSLLPFVGKDDTERRVIINTIGAHWEGNQVWFITAGGAIFAAFPLIYATAFSGFYWALMAALWAMFFKPVGFKYRSMIKNDAWRNAWDWLLFVGSVVPAVIFGVAFGNLLLGVPFGFDEYLISRYTGSFWELLSPFALLCGLVSFCMIAMQGGTFLAHRTLDDIQHRAIKLSQLFAVLFVVLFVLAGFWVVNLDGYRLLTALDGNAILTPLDKQVMLAKGAWLDNYRATPLLWILPVLGVAGAILTMILLQYRQTLLAFLASSLAILGTVTTAGVAMFPFMMPSSSHPNMSLTLYDSVSSHLTLMIMLFVVVFLLPMVVTYTSWGYAVMRGKVTKAYIQENEKSLY